MIRLFLLVTLVAVLAPAVRAQRALTGTDASTGETLPGATVSVLNAAGAVVGGTATGLDGRFALRLATVPADVAVRACSASSRSWASTRPRARASGWRFRCAPGPSACCPRARRPPRRWHLARQRPAVRQFALEGAVPVPLVGPALTAFGALRAQTGIPPAGDRYALVAYEHSFRTLPFEVLGLHALARRQYNVLVHGTHGRTWGGPLAHTRWHHEVGVSLSGLFGGLRLDLTQRLDERRTTVGVGVARVF